MHECPLIISAPQPGAPRGARRAADACRLGTTSPPAPDGGQTAAGPEDAAIDILQRPVVRLRCTGRAARPVALTLRQPVGAMLGFVYGADAGAAPARAVLRAGARCNGRPPAAAPEMPARPPSRPRPEGATGTPRPHCIRDGEVLYLVDASAPAAAVLAHEVAAFLAQLNPCRVAVVGRPAAAGGAAEACAHRILRRAFRAWKPLTHAPPSAAGIARRSGDAQAAAHMYCAGLRYREAAEYGAAVQTFAQASLTYDRAALAAEAVEAVEQIARLRPQCPGAEASLRHIEASCHSERVARAARDPD